MIGGNWIVGVVGVLQLDVLTSRAAQEYKVEIGFDGVAYTTARWLRSDDEAVLNTFIEQNKNHVVLDRNEMPVFLSDSEWALNYKIKSNEAIDFMRTMEIQ
ncbi:MAG: hypothetical protein ACR2RA_07300 [Geminicoccaceae bacterium]